MSAVLDNRYRSMRLRLRSVTLAEVARAWAQASSREPDAFVGQAVAVVLAGQAQVVRLVDAYMTSKTLDATGRGALKGLDPLLYTVDAIRKVPAVEVYARPFGALGHALGQGSKFAAARAAGAAAVSKLAATDLQLAQTYSARDWMMDEPSVRGYSRVAGAGACELCALAAERLYRSEDLAPIHEHCSCDVVPVYDDGPTDSPLPDALAVVGDDELGSRLADPDWQVAA